jgi:hypothetical protein
MADHPAQVGRVDQVVGVDHADDLDARVEVLALHHVEGAGLEPLRLDVQEPHPRAVRAVLGHRTVGLRVGSVVVHDEDLEVGIVDRLQGPDRLQQHVGRFVVRGHEQGDPRPVGRIGRRDRPGRPGPAQRVHPLEREVSGDEQREQLQHEEDRRRRPPGDGEPAGEGQVPGEDQVRARARDESAEEQLADRVPVRQRQYHGRRDDQADDGPDQGVARHQAEPAREQVGAAECDHRGEQDAYEP